MSAFDAEEDLGSDISPRLRFVSKESPGDVYVDMGRSLLCLLKRTSADVWRMPVISLQLASVCSGVSRAYVFDMRRGHAGVFCEIGRIFARRATTRA